MTHATPAQLVIHIIGPKLPKLASKYRPLVPVLREHVLRPVTFRLPQLLRHPRAGTSHQPSADVTVSFLGTTVPH